MLKARSCVCGCYFLRTKGWSGVPFWQLQCYEQHATLGFYCQCFFLFFMVRCLTSHFDEDDNIDDDDDDGDNDDDDDDDDEMTG